MIGLFKKKKSPRDETEPKNMIYNKMRMNSDEQLFNSNSDESLSPGRQNSPPNNIRLCVENNQFTALALSIADNRKSYPKETIIKFIDSLSTGWVDDYAKWLSVAIFLYYIDNEMYFDVWDNFSKKSKNYNNKDNQRYWKSFSNLKWNRSLLDSGYLCDQINTHVVELSNRINQFDV